MSKDNGDDGRTYSIRTLADFNKVPKERRAACLAEFLDYLDFVDQTPIPGYMGHLGFTWSDDGRPGISGIDFVAEPA